MDATGRDEFASSVGRAEMLRNAGGCHIAIEGGCKTIDHLRALTGCQGSWRIRREDEVPVEIHDESIVRRSEKGATFSRDTEDVRTRFLNQLACMSGVHHGNVQPTPLVNAHAVADCLSCKREHGRVVTDENDSPGWGDCCFNYTNNVGNRQTVEQRPHVEVLESRWGRGELVAESVVLHVNPDQIVQSRSRKAQDAGDLFGVEEVGGLVPVNPHAPKVISQQIVQRVTRQEAQAVWDPVRLIRVVVEIAFGTFPKLPDGFSAFVVGPRPDTESDTVKSVSRVLLEDEGVVNAVRLGSARADLDIVGETGLAENQLVYIPLSPYFPTTYPHRSVQRPSNLIVLLHPWATSQDLRLPELSNGALHVANLALGRRLRLDPLRRLAADTTYHVRMGECLGRSLCGRLGVESRRDGLGDARVQGGGTAGDDERVVGFSSGRRAVSRRGSEGKGVVLERGSHVDTQELQSSRELWDESPTSTRGPNGTQLLEMMDGE